MKNINQSSSNPEPIKLRIKAGEWEFEAEGEAQTVIQQLEKFQDLFTGWRITPPHKESPRILSDRPYALPSPNKQELSPPYLERIFESDPHSSLLLCRIPPAGHGAEAKLVLLLLFGYLELRGVTEVSALTLKQAIKRSFHPVLRLDRLLSEYIRDRFVLKTGRGKGGKYRLTPLGVKKAMTLTEELASEWTQT